jgi:glycosyltransferase involved in cell wall biosynthesis
MPIVALEAITSGIPIVSFDIPALSWTEDSFALKALPFDTADYARLMRVAAIGKTLPQMRENARKFSKRFDRTKMSKLYEQLFIDILEKR